MVEPMIGNLAWAPLPAFGEVEVLDRFNGVPTLGVYGNPGDRVLFWRVIGYVPRRDVSVWMYVPLGADDEHRLETASDSDLLDGLIFNSRVPRRVTLGVARSYRLRFEYPWDLPPGLPPEQIVDRLMPFLIEELRVTLGQTAGAQRKAAEKASEAVRELAAI